LANVAVDAVFDSVSIATTFREELGKAGVIFCSISEAVKEYPDLVRKHMGSVVSNFACGGGAVVVGGVAVAAGGGGCGIRREGVSRGGVEGVAVAAGRRV
jgi:Fe-S cluster assembly scaffold protein SufB